MRRVRLSDEVWEAIADKGKFGETEDDVLRRLFKLPPAKGSGRRGPRGRGSTRYATQKMSARVEHGLFTLEFEGGAREQWRLPSDQKDVAAIKSVRDAAVRFGLDNGASDPGQTNAIRKALTEAGYYVSKSRVQDDEHA